MNAPIGPFTVDFLGPDHHLIVELEVLGYRVIRFTWRQLTQRPREVMEAVRRLLS